MRWGAGALAFAGLMFLLYPAVRPWHDESAAAGAHASMASGAWVASHFLAMLGFIAVAVWRSGVLPPASGVPFAIGFALFLPQFYLPAGARIAHGVLLAAGCFWLAAALAKARVAELSPVT